MPELSISVNGATRTVLAHPHESLLDVLRETLSLTGTKRGCNEATCGACTVLMDGVPVLSCITPAMRCSGREITTIEGVGEKGQFHPVQESLVASGAIQCGFCTPGMVMTIIALLNEDSNPSEAQIRMALSGNLCRCTGYTKIIAAVKHVAAALTS